MIIFESMMGKYLKVPDLVFDGGSDVSCFVGKSMYQNLYRLDFKDSPNVRLDDAEAIPMLVEWAESYFHKNMKFNEKCRKAFGIL